MVLEVQTVQQHWKRSWPGARQVMKLLLSMSRLARLVQFLTDNESHVDEEMDEKDQESHRLGMLKNDCVV